ncbi:MAG TPA: glycine cleavage T C-terminal barrel domain-containing protein [Acidimicrobiales bacterium]|nr:glycine cleavage T C-terminal barrel domain-containing protein [Acidimicrobiales bacterium]
MSEAALLDGVGAAEVPRTFVTVTGPDAVSFLQGQLSQDVEAMDAGGSALSFLLHPQGKVVALLRVTRLDDDVVLLDTDGGLARVLVDRLERFKLRVKADITVAPWRCISVRGSERPEGVAGLPSLWPDWPGVDVFGESPPPLPDGIAACTPEEMEVARIIRGVPRSGVEIDDRTIPAETGLVDRAVSFTKGCYTGQELVARIDSRGHVNRHLRRLTMTGGPGAVPAPGTTVESGDKEVGVLTSAAWSTTREVVVALGYVRREVDPGREVTVAGAAARVEP